MQVFLRRACIKVKLWLIPKVSDSNLWWRPPFEKQNGVASLSKLKLLNTLR